MIVKATNLFKGVAVVDINKMNAALLSCVFLAWICCSEELASIRKLEATYTSYHNLTEVTQFIFKDMIDT